MTPLYTAIVLCLLITSGFSSQDGDSCTSDQCAAANHDYHSIIIELMNHLDSHNEHKELVERTLMEGANSSDTQSDGIDLLSEMYTFLNSVLTLSPSSGNTMTVPLWFYKYAFTQSGKELLRMPAVNNWIRRWLNQWALYLDSPESISDILSWSDSVDFNVDSSDYVIPDDGFQSFNDFFCREMKPERRPIESAHSPLILSSPADAVLDYVIDDISVNDPDHRFMVKDVEFNVLQILDNDAETARKYEHGTLMLLSLYFHNYHHYHSYCDAQVDRVHLVDSGYYFCFGFENEKLMSNCTLEDIPGCHAYMSHVNRRGIVDLKCNAQHEGGGGRSFDSTMIAVGLGHVSSIAMEVQSADNVVKGQRIGHFAYGGSTMILLFPPGVIDEVIPEIGTELKMGQDLARIKA